MCRANIQGTRPGENREDEGDTLYERMHEVMKEADELKCSAYIELVDSLLNCERHYTFLRREGRKDTNYRSSTMLFMKSAQKYWRSH